MPIYEYKCSKCDQTFEVMQTFSEGPLGTHPGCGGDVRKLISAPGIIFKGSGFYVTDSKKAQSAVTSTPAAPKTETPKSETKKSETSAKPSTPTTESTDSKK